MVLGLPLAHILILAAVAAAGSFVMGTVGFGFGMITVGLFSFFVGVRNANVAVTMFSALIQSVAVIPLLSAIRPAAVIWPVVGIAAGMPLGILFLSAIPDAGLRVGLGIVILVFATYSLIVHNPPKLRPSPLSGIPAGIVTGALGGAFGIPGPPLVIYLMSSELDARARKATLLATFFLMTFYKIPLLAANRLIDGRILTIAAILTPAVLLGTLLGTVFFARISEILVRRITLFVLFGSGLALVIRGIVAILK